MLVAGEQAVEERIAQHNAELAAQPAMPEPSAEPDDGHEETVEEVKAKMAAAQKAMDEGIAQTDQRVESMAQEQASMPNFGALANVHSTLANMGSMRKKNQISSLASKLGVEMQAGDEQLAAEDLTGVMIQRAKDAGKTEKEIEAALAD
uniref:Uncharacterized protein n=1 Tax=Strombidium inclinatum TaxID=197538 RepID=A0A7S3IZL0_9SPIT|mmetsp:Transcript_6517/g.10470  ORF Transcript_6517/g.10470 Transcript_6517/m.10470 type:complete len:149 (+) Transcript_6517:887-1333(+)